MTAGTWVEEGTGLLLDAVDGLADAELDERCGLPGWTRRHLLAHVASNAEALGRLLSWARTGVECRMYASPGQRAGDIDAGAARPAAELRGRVRRTAREFAAAVAALPEAAWAVPVVTATGRGVRAREVPWLRAREVCVHAVDLGTGVTFADLPVAFCRALVEDAAGLRGGRADGPALVVATPEGAHEIAGRGTPRRVDLPVDVAAAWLTGRADRPDLPTLPAWL